jgi:DNA-binding CsgD family transcriptional regulator
MKGRPLTNAEIETIKMLSANNVLQKKIAEVLGLSRGVVSKIQNKLSLSRYERDCLSDDQELEILDLARQGLGARRIAAKTGIREWRITRVLKKQLDTRHRLGTARRYKLSDLERRDIRRKFRAFEGQIACEYGVPRRQISAMRRAIFSRGQK